MQIRRSATQIEVLAPAKINLFFEVLKRRDDGFHEIESLMVPISLYDTLVFQNDPAGRVTFSARWVTAHGARSNPNAFAPPADDEPQSIPQGDDNYVVQAIRLLAQRAGVRRGAKLELVKRIPAAAGLGGGSSDAAAALVAANLGWSLHWPTERLAGMAAEIGSDAPFFLTARPAICMGRGEKIQRVSGLGTLHFVIVRPPQGLSTRAVYHACSPGSPPRSVEPVINALRGKELGDIGPLAHNRLIEPAIKLSPWIQPLLDKLTRTTCPVIGMSGSGTTCFAMCGSARHARTVAAQLRCGPTPMGQVWAVSSI